MRSRGLIVTALTALLVLAAAPQAGAYRYEDSGRWEIARIPYWVSSSSLKAPVARAASAWNNLNLRVKFVRVAKRSDAYVTIKPDADRCVGGVTQVIGITQTSNVPGQPAKLEYIARARVLIARGCSLKLATIIAAHEFGHVLGLNHEPKKCALMNPSGDATGTSTQCRNMSAAVKAQLFKADDLAGIRKLYKAPLASPRPGGYDQQIDF